MRATTRRGRQSTTRRGPCPVCGKPVALKVCDGKVRQHQRDGVNCPGTGRPPGRPEVPAPPATFDGRPLVTVQPRGDLL